MKKFLSIFAIAILFSVAFLSTGCGEDTPALGPDAEIVTGPTPSTVVEEAGTFVYFTVTGSKGTADLESVTVNGPSGKLSIDDFEVDGVLASANPFLVDNKEAISYEIGVKVKEPAGEAVYTVILTDVDGLTHEHEVTVTVEEKIEAIVEGATINLYNQGGPVGYGGIDLDNGATTGTSLHVPTGNDSYLDAELRDMGLDLTQTGDPALNWYQRIGGINGTEVRQIAGGLSSAEFGGVASKEAIVALYDNASAFTETIPGYDFNVSAKVSEGDAFVVYKSGTTDRYYLVVVNDIVVTPGLQDNDDHYNVSIKY